ncbi:MAG: hypothetical protein DCO96_02370 [Fluviicola sp. XM-24bin1]|nr:MAG: hypothetical protein DCO96_02370 [Fluviicola sp. XM-24bin1]
MSYQLTEQQFLEHFQNADFVLKTQEQIAKDFERLGYETPKSLREKAFSYDELVDIVADLLIDVVKLGESQTLQLLYTIDIPQSKFLALTTDLHFVTKGAELIIKREAQKVYLRSQLSD